MERALHEALVRWRKCRCERLALNIDILSERLLCTRPQCAADRWNAVAARRRAEELPGLLSTLAEVGSSRFLAQLDALRGFEPDPRVAQAVRFALESREDLAAPAYRALWRRVFAVLASIGDPRARGWLPPLIQAQRGGTTTSLRWLRQQTSSLCGALPEPQPTEVEPLPPPPPRLDALSSAQRLVLADALSEQGDPFGEFLVLQHQDPLPPVAQRRCNVLVRDYGRRWLGPLSRAIRPRGLRFERGVVVACSLSGGRAAEFTNHPGWAWVRTLEVGGLQYATRLAPVLEFLRAPVLARVRELVGVPVWLLWALLDGPLPFQLEHVEVPGWVQPAEFELVLRHRAFAGVKSFVANGRWLRSPAQAPATPRDSEGVTPRGARA
ncbi:MAG: hypothetical protein ACOZQL_10345 [Myxococcota bacterium]